MKRCRRSVAPNPEIEALTKAVGRLKGELECEYTQKKVKLLQQKAIITLQEKQERWLRKTQLEKEVQLAKPEWRESSLRKEAFLPKEEMPVNWSLYQDGWLIHKCCCGSSVDTQLSYLLREL